MTTDVRAHWPKFAFVAACGDRLMSDGPKLTIEAKDYSIEGLEVGAYRRPVLVVRGEHYAVLERRGMTYILMHERAATASMYELSGHIVAYDEDRLRSAALRKWKQAALTAVGIFAGVLIPFLPALPHRAQHAVRGIILPGAHVFSLGLQAIGALVFLALGGVTAKVFWWAVALFCWADVFVRVAARFEEPRREPGVGEIFVATWHGIRLAMGLQREASHMARELASPPVVQHVQPSAAPSAQAFVFDAQRDAARDGGGLSLQGDPLPKMHAHRDDGGVELPQVHAVRDTAVDMATQDDAAAKAAAQVGATSARVRRV